MDVRNRLTKSSIFCKCQIEVYKLCLENGKKSKILLHSRRQYIGKYKTRDSFINKIVNKIVIEFIIIIIIISPVSLLLWYEHYFILKSFVVSASTREDVAEQIVAENLTVRTCPNLNLWLTLNCSTVIRCQNTNWLRH